MQYAELTPDERLVLAGLIRSVVHADGRLSPREFETMSRLAREWAADEFLETLDAAREQLTDAAALRRAVLSVSRPLAQAWMATVLSELAESLDPMEQVEPEILRFLEAVWGVVIRR